MTDFRIYDRVNTRVGNRVYRRAGDLAVELVGIRVAERVENIALAIINDELEDPNRMWGRVADRVWGRVEPRVRDRVWVRVRKRVWARSWRSIYNMNDRAGDRAMEIVND